MGFSERAKLTALAIVHIFETSKPLGDYSAVAVLKDGAGVSYGKSQFTHRSGSLEAVLRRFHKICKECGTQPLLEGYEKQLANRSAQSIDDLSHDQRFKNGLRAAGRRPEMQQAQREIAFENYLKPAIEACEGSDFVLPLSLAVIYDSINHGSFAKIRDRVKFQGPGNGSIKPIEFEKEWISEYVRRRDAWLENHVNPLLRQTDYRTDFFLAQIAKGNWDLRLPVNVHGYRLTDADIEVGADENEQAAELPAVDPPESEPATKPSQESSSQSTDEAPPPIKENGRQETGDQEFGRFDAFLPQIDTAKGWLKRATAGTGLGAVLAFIFGLPQWLQIGLFVLLVVIVIGAIVIFVKYHDRIFDYVKSMNTLRATEDTGSPVIVGKPPTD